MAYNYRNFILMIDLTIRVSEAFLICEHANSFDSRISISLRIWYASMPIVLIVAYQWSLRIWYASMPIVLIVAYGFEIRYFPNGHWGFDMRLCPWHMVLRSDTSIVIEDLICDYALRICLALLSHSLYYHYIIISSHQWYTLLDWKLTSILSIGLSSLEDIDHILFLS